MEPQTGRATGTASKSWLSCVVLLCFAYRFRTHNLILKEVHLNSALSRPKSRSPSVCKHASGSERQWASSYLFTALFRFGWSPQARPSLFWTRVCCNGPIPPSQCKPSKIRLKLSFTAFEAIRTGISCCELFTSLTSTHMVCKGCRSKSGDAQSDGLCKPIPPEAQGRRRKLLLFSSDQL